MKKFVILLPLLLAACATQPQSVYDMTNTRLCKEWAHSKGSMTVQHEMQRRQLDCGPILNYAAQQETADALRAAARPKTCREDKKGRTYCY